ncbi:MAG: hypothetical protein WAP37_07455 [Solirubrobacterales bacterium]
MIDTTSIAIVVREDRRTRTHAALVALTAFVFLGAVLGIHGAIREIAALVAFTFTPGAAFMTRRRGLGTLMTLGMAAAFSLATLTVGSWALLSLSLFYPWLLLTALMGWAVVVLCREIARSAAEHAASGDRGKRPSARSPRVVIGEFTRDNGPELKATLPIVFGLGLWMVSLTAIDTGAMTDIGLPSVLPLTWWAGLIAVLCGGGVYICSKRPNRWVISAYVASVAVILYATLPLVDGVAHYPAAYKHVGVVRLLLEEGHVVPSVDIYNRWPGFFAMAGVFTRFAGAANPIHYIGWAELYFALLQATLVAAIALRESRRAAVAGCAALLFILINWIGQGYYSPQALVFTLALATLAIVLSQLSDTGNRLGDVANKIVGMIARVPPPRARRRGRQWSARSVISLVLLMEVAITISHQLTPYALALQVGVLIACGFAWPRWLLVATAVIPVIYLLPNLAWVNDHFGVFTALDPFSNAKVNDPIAVKCGGCATVGNMATLSSAFAWLAAIAAIFVLARRAKSFRVTAFGLMLLAPFGFLVGQNYGGEAPLRVVLFTSPLSACLIAAAIATLKPMLRLISTLAAVGLLAVTFVFAFYGGEPFSSVIESDIRASEYIYENGRPGSIVMSAAPTFPDLVNPRYPKFTHLSGGGSIILFDRPGEQAGRLGGGRESVEFVVTQMRGWGPRGYIVFSPSMTRYNAFNGLATPAETALLQSAMVRSGRFKLWHKDGETRVYELIR